jgi:sugar lactone lactonase YvrE
MIKKTIAILIVLIIGLVITVKWLSPAQFNPAAFDPPVAPLLSDIWSPNHLLTKATLLAKGQIKGPETVDEDKNGYIYGGMADGRIVRFLPNSHPAKLETFANTGGRPLGIQFDAKGNLIVADAIKGLLSIDPSGHIKSLVTQVDGIPLGFTDDLDISSDGNIYFSDASTKYDIHHFRMDILEARPWGRLIEYSPSTGEARTLLNKLYFANGVALSKNEDFVLVNETSRYRITRYWLSGPKKGTSDIFINNLPGFPDGISSNHKGVFWLAIPNPRNPALDAMHPYPFLKELAVILPQSLQPQPQKYGFVVALNERAKVLGTLQDPTGDHLSEITAVHQINDHILMGSLHNDRIGRMPVPDFAK